MPHLLKKIFTSKLFFSLLLAMISIASFCIPLLTYNSDISPTRQIVLLIENGILDLSTWDITRDGRINLAGN